MVSHLKVIRVGGAFSSVVSHCLKTRGVVWLRSDGWGAAEQGKLRDPSMSNPGKRNSCGDAQANISKRDFSRACVVAPVLRRVKTVPIRPSGESLWGSVEAELVSEAALGCRSLLARAAGGLGFCRRNVRVKAFSCEKGGLRFPPSDV